MYGNVYLLHFYNVCFSSQIFDTVAEFPCFFYHTFGIFIDTKVVYSNMWYLCMGLYQFNYIYNIYMVHSLSASPHLTSLLIYIYTGISIYYSSYIYSYSLTFDIQYIYRQIKSTSRSQVLRNQIEI